MKAPYPYFGGKSPIMPEVWRRLGDAYNFVDPFLGSNAPLLSRPGWGWEAGQWADGKNRIETVNDKDCFIANFWRAVNSDPEQVAHYANGPVNEADLHARHLWLINNTEFKEKMKTDPDYFDPKVAGWWVWGISQWIGSGWCIETANQRPHLGDSGRGVHRTQLNIYEYFEMLSKRLRRVRVCCGDWSRVLGPAPTHKVGLTAVFLDPPYGEDADRSPSLYATDSLSIAHQVRAWAIENGDNPRMRIALCGYEKEHIAYMPDNWEMLNWSTNGGYSSNLAGNDNKHKERIWFSPHCLKPQSSKQLSLLDLETK